jgi:hypothetical protein
MKNPFKAEIAEEILTMCEEKGLNEFETALHCAAVIAALQPDAGQAVRLVEEVYNQADQVAA